MFDYDRVFANSFYLLTERELELTPFTSERVYLPFFYEMSMQRMSDDWLSFKLQLHSTAEVSLEVADVYPNFDLQQPEHGLYTRLFSLLECPDKLAILIKVRQLGIEASAVAILKIFRGRTWGCIILKHSEATSLRQLVENTGILQHHDGLSDRSITSVLPGSYITAATKSRPGLYLAHITFLPASYFWNE
jgi:hypothetical protein